MRPRINIFESTFGQASVPAPAIIVPELSPQAFAGRSFEEIVFWSNQLSEHAFILALALEEITLKADANGFRLQWEEFRKTKLNNPPAGIDEANLLISEYKNLALNLRLFKTHIMERLENKEWLGWAYYSFVDHIRRELDYSVEVLNNLQDKNSLSPAGSLCTVLKLSMEHAAVISHMLDPVEPKYILEARQEGIKFGQLHAACTASDPTLIAVSEHAGQQLDQWLGIVAANKPKSIIHPALLAHIQREQKKFLQIMSQIGGG